MALSLRLVADEVSTTVDAEIQRLSQLLVEDHQRALGRVRAQARARYAIIEAKRDRQSRDEWMAQLSPHAREVVENVLDDPPVVERFSTVDETLAAWDELIATGELTKLLIGRSAEGRSIAEYVLDGDDDRHAWVIGDVHSNEPLGNETGLYMARLLLAEGELGRRSKVTWHFIPCIDPDGMARNLWITDPEYTRNRDEVRTPWERQAIATFPCRYVSEDGNVVEVSPDVPEMLAMKERFDAHKGKIVAVVELHNADSGGGMFISQAVRQLPPDVRDQLLGDLVAIPSGLGIPLTRNPMEGADPNVPSFSGVTDIVATPALTGIPLAGYLPGVPVLHPDISLFVFKGAGDQRPTDHSYADIVRDFFVAERWEAYNLLAPGLRDAVALLPPSPLLDAALDRVRVLVSGIDREEALIHSPEAQRPATKEEAGYLIDYTRAISLRRSTATVRQALTEGISANPHPSVITFLAHVMEFELRCARRAEECTLRRVRKSDAVAAHAAVTKTFVERMAALPVPQPPG